MSRKVVITRTVVQTTIADRSLWGNDSDTEITEVESEDGQFFESLFMSIETDDPTVKRTVTVQFIEGE